MFTAVAQHSATHLFNAWGVLSQVPATDGLGTQMTQMKIWKIETVHKLFSGNQDPSMVGADVVEKNAAKPAEIGREAANDRAASH